MKKHLTHVTPSGCGDPSASSLQPSWREIALLSLQSAALPGPAVPVRASWLNPLARKLAEIQAEARDTFRSEDETIARLAALIAEIPATFERMDHDALANALESAMGSAAVSGAAYVLGKVASEVRRQKSDVRPLTSDIGSPTSDIGHLILLAAPSMEFSFGPWDAAAERLAKRTPVAAPLTSAEWGDVPLALRDRAFWSARVESARLVSQMHADVSAAFTEARDSRGRRFDRDNFIGRARDLAVAEGITTTGDPAEMGGIKDIRSVPRLGLIYDTNTTMAQNWARQRTDFAAGALDAYPAWRLERVEDRLRPRGEAFWRGRWQQAGASVGWEGADKASMSALKTSPIWMALGSLGPFGNPYPPFEWGSGMGISDLTRAEAEAIGLLKPDQPMPADATPPGFNANLKADAGELDPRVLSKLQEQFGDQIRVESGRASWNDDLLGKLYDERSDFASHVELGRATPTADQKALGSGVMLGDSTLSVLGDSPLGNSRIDAQAIAHVWRAPDHVESIRGDTRIKMSKKTGRRQRTITLEYDAETDTYTPVAYEAS